MLKFIYAFNIITNCYKNEFVRIIIYLGVAPSINRFFIFFRIISSVCDKRYFIFMYAHKKVILLLNL